MIAHTGCSFKPSIEVPPRSVLSYRRCRRRFPPAQPQIYTPHPKRNIKLVARVEALRYDKGILKHKEVITMTFGENLQFLRKRGGLTQEDLAEKMEVSRQSVSKWESNAAWPEMDAILRLCDLFGVDMDTLLRGDVQAALAEDTAGYDRHMNAFSKAIAGGVGLILLGVTVLVALLTGLTADAEVAVYPLVGTAILLSCIAIAAAIFIVYGMGHDRFRKKHPAIRPFYTEEQLDAYERRFPLLITLPVVLILIGVVVQVAIVLVPSCPIWIIMTSGRFWARPFCCSASP